jgi:Ca2+-binding RTX toxin-like protein
MTALNSKNTSVSGTKTFTEVTSGRSSHNITGNSDNNWVTFQGLDVQYNPFHTEGDIRISIDLGGGDVDTVFFTGDVEPVYLRANSDPNSAYELVSSGGHEEDSGTLNTFITSLEIKYRNVEKFHLGNANDVVELAGTSGSYDVYGGSGNDILWGNDARNVFYGGSGNDDIEGRGGADNLYGENGTDFIYGGSGNDYISGGSGNDALWGDADADELRGDAGKDTLEGGAGNDTLSGGADIDVFKFHNDGSTDRVTDFEAGEVLQLDIGDPNDVSITANASIDGFTISFDDTEILLEGVGTDKTFNKIDGGSFTEITMNSGGGSNDTVICTYMFQRGYIPAEVYKWDGVYGQRLGAEVLAGYHAWAIPLVEHVLKRSEIATQLVRPLACAWAQEMAHRCDPASHPKGSALGRVILALGVPLCRAIARVRRAALPLAAR